MDVNVALKNVCPNTGEGPHWDTSTQSLLFVDIESGTINNWNTATDAHSSVKFAKPVGFVVPHADGGYVAGIKHELVHIEVDWSESLVTSTESICSVEKETGNRFNDGKCDASGRLWAGTMGPIREGKLVMHAGSLYSLERDGSHNKHLDNIDISNGLAWTADKSTMFYIDSIPRQIYAFDFDICKGTLSNRRVLIDYNKHESSSTLGLPDGMCIDVEDKLWVAGYNSSAVVRWDPVTGAQLRRVEFPARRITSCCWGGPNLDELYVTCAGPAYQEEEEKLATPLSGSIFKVTGLGVKGVEASMYEG